jgi:hypothetical protein
LTLLAKYYITHGGNCDKIVFCEGDEEMNEDGVLSCKKNIFMKYITVIQEKNHSITTLDLNPDDNWFVK